MSCSTRMRVKNPNYLLLLALLHLLSTLMSMIEALPTIQKQQQHQQEHGPNCVQQQDKSFFQPREIEQTIDEVQKILANDPALPRLTRGEIEELYEKVTREEYEKSIEAGDMSRADSMRALMLVLPYNTDNNTEENLQELYTRPPVTRVIDVYTPPNPIKFTKPDPSAVPRSTVPGGNPDVAATTYKPTHGSSLQKQLFPAPTATTYHPSAPAPVIYQLTPSLASKPSMKFLPVTKHTYDYTKTNPNLQSTLRPAASPLSSAQRFSSHYSAKNAQFLRQPKPPMLLVQTTSSSNTVKPVADILESLGIVGGIGGGVQSKRYAKDDFYPAESAPQSVVAVADLRGLQGARIQPDAYFNFKPLNIGEELRAEPEVESYLTRFGIVRKSPKALKKSQASEIPPSPTEEPTGVHTQLSTATAKLPALQSNAELTKLLKNLQELERLQAKTARQNSTTTITSAAPPSTPIPTVQLITHGAPLLIEPKKPRRRIDPNIDINFANAGNQQKPASSADELSKLLQNLQDLEKLKINPEHVLKSTSPGTQALSNRFSVSSTTPIPTITTSPTITKSSITISNDARDLQLILRQLHHLEQTNALHKPASSSTTTTIRPKPKPAPVPAPALDLALGAADLLQLQSLLNNNSQLERLYVQARNTKKAIKIKSTTTTTSTTPRPSKAATAVDHAQFEALITRVQQLEQLQQPQPTTPGFITQLPRQSLPSNDYAQLRHLLAMPLGAGFDLGQVEISTAASISKQRQQPLNSFESSNGLLGDVQPQDYVQLQKLLSKVQELERVELQEAHPTPVQQLATAASLRSQNVKNWSGAQIVYAQPVEQEEQLKLELPVYRQPVTAKPLKPAKLEQPSSSDELREFAMSKLVHPATGGNQDFEHYQQFFTSLEDNGDRQSYQLMQPIFKAVTRAPPQPPQVSAPTSKPKQTDLAELQKLLYNTQQLQKLGVALPNELSQQLESQFSPTSSSSSSTITTAAASIVETSPSPVQHDSSSPAVFSLTTRRPTAERVKPTMESSVQLPIFSATKIIEAAIKRAANRIGVPTQQPFNSLGLGFRRRTDDAMGQAMDDEQQQDGVIDGNLMAEFSELNYQLAKPEPKAEQLKVKIDKNLIEIQRLLRNLEQLQQLNVSLKAQSQADASYLQSQPTGIDTTKSRRQSADNSNSSTVVADPKEGTTQSSTHLSLDLGLSDVDTGTDLESRAGTTERSSSPSTTTTEESRNGSLDDLADSFGPNPVNEELLPPTKKNGFYFLADWNSFLEVGDGDDQVVVRLSPKIGDPRDFLAV